MKEIYQLMELAQANKHLKRKALELWESTSGSYPKERFIPRLEEVLEEVLLLISFIGCKS